MAGGQGLLDERAVGEGRGGACDGTTSWEEAGAGGTGGYNTPSQGEREDGRTGLGWGGEVRVPDHIAAGRVARGRELQVSMCGSHRKQVAEWVGGCGRGGGGLWARGGG